MTVAVLTCRLESTRLYGKPMHLIGDKPIIKHLVDQLRIPDSIDEIVLGISDGPGKGVFIDFADSEGIPYVVGPEFSPLTRMVRAAELVGADTIARVTPDNPFVYIDNMDEMIALHREQGNALTVNLKLPLGSTIEIIDIKAQQTALAAADIQSKHHEHASMYIVDHPDLFKIQRVMAPLEVQRPDVRLTVDNPEDLIFVRKIYEALAPEGEPISIGRIVRYLDENPKLGEINGSLQTMYLWG